MDRFDAAAATWDANPHRRALAQAIVAAITAAVPIAAGTRLVEIGCGTGLVGLPLAARGASLLGIDLAPGMVREFLAKAAASRLTAVRGEVRDVVAEPLPPASADVVVSAMACHHIVDVDALLAALACVLAPGGWLMIADLEAEDGSFHAEPVPHRGFAPAAFAARVAAAGFVDVRAARVHELERPDRGRRYPVFLAAGRRR